LRDQYIYFVAVDATDFATRETGLSSFTVYRSRNGGTATAYTTPTIAELSAANMPGVYSFLLDEDMTIDSGDDSQEMVFHITHTGMAPVTRTIEIYRRTVTSGSTSVAQTGDSYARLGAPAGASIAADIATVDTVVDGIQTDLSNGTDGLGAIKTAVDAVPTAAANADAVWDEATAGHVTASTFGVAVTDILADTNELQTDDYPTTLATLATAAALATVDTNVDAILVDTGTTLPAQISGLNDLDAAAVAAAVWNAATATYGSAGSYGLLIETNLDAVLSTEFAAVPTATENADALLNRDMSAVSDTNARSPLNAFRFMRNKWSISGTTMTVTKEDDTTAAWTASLTTNASAEPVTASDPA